MLSKLTFFFSHHIYSNILIIWPESMHVVIVRQFMFNYIRWGSTKNDRWGIPVIGEIESNISPMLFITKFKKKSVRVCVYVGGWG